MIAHLAIVGAGFAGAVLARQLVESGKFRITVFDARPHVAGNCHTARDKETGVMLHHYGPHIFQTNREEVWDYVNRFGRFGAYTNRVKAITERGVFSLPINLLTINQFFGKQLSPAQARDFVGGLGDRTITDPANFEEQALKFLGREMYDAFFYGYTKKQWGVEPRDLPASILQRLPIRFNYDDNYYNARFQGIPVEGYTAIVSKLLDHSSIEVRLSERFDGRVASGAYDHVFFSGPLDSWFGHSEGRLQYRSLVFERFDETGDYQGNPVINYCSEKVPYTRISEHKHFTPWEEHERTVCFKEYSKLAEPGDTPYYPLRLADDKRLLETYAKMAEDETNVTFIGRLGTYRYLDMHVVIGESLDLARQCLAASENRAEWPRFSAKPV